MIRRASLNLSVDLAVDSKLEQTDQANRDCAIAWILPHEAPELFRVVYDVVHELNRRFYRFDIETIPCIQYTVYREGHFYDWHSDVLDDSLSQRKLSWSIQLTDPDRYEGGDLEVMGSRIDASELRRRGQIVAFPSFEMHRVTRVEKGERRALVGWVEGPRWR